MKCREVKPLLYLYREGELPDEVRRRIDEHVASCRSCLHELREIRSSGSVIDALRSAEPQLRAPEGLTDQIMRLVESSRSADTGRRTQAAFFSFRRLQFSCTLAAALIAAAFFIQTLMDAFRMAALESRLDRLTSAAEIGTDEPSLAAMGLSTIAEFGKFLAETPLENRPSLYGWLLLRDDGRFLSDLLHGGPPEYSGEVERLRAKYPELWSLSPLRGLTGHDRLVLSRQGGALMKDIRRLLQTNPTSP